MSCNTILLIVTVESDTMKYHKFIATYYKIARGQSSTYENYFIIIIHHNDSRISHSHQHVHVVDILCMHTLFYAVII